MSDCTNDTTINTSDGDKETPIHIFNSWDDLELNPDLLRGIYGYGFEKPSPIQSKAIHPIKQGRDLIAQAQSGTGKTATFTIGALSLLDIKDNSNQVLILAPTHELRALFMDYLL